MAAFSLSHLKPVSPQTTQLPSLWCKRSEFRQWPLSGTNFFLRNGDNWARSGRKIALMRTSAVGALPDSPLLQHKKKGGKVYPDQSNPAARAESLQSGQTSNLDPFRPVHIQLRRSRFGRCHERIIGKMRVAGRAGDADVTDHLADRVKINPGIDHKRGRTMPEIVQMKII